MASCATFVAEPEEDDKKCDKEVESITNARSTVTTSSQSTATGRRIDVSVTCMGSPTARFTDRIPSPNVERSPKVLTPEAKKMNPPDKEIKKKKESKVVAVVSAKAAKGEKPAQKAAQKAMLWAKAWCGAD